MFNFYFNHFLFTKYNPKTILTQYFVIVDNTSILPAVISISAALVLLFAVTGRLIYLKRVRQITTLARKMISENTGSASKTEYPNILATNPIENAITMLNQLKHSTTNVTIKKNVDYVLSLLARDDMFALDEEAFKPLDEETKSWMVNSVLQPRLQPPKRKNTRVSIDITHVRSEVLALFKRATTTHLIDFSISDSSLRKIASILETFDSWNFDVFDLYESSGGRPITFLMYFVLEKRKLMQVFEIDRLKLIKFCAAVEKNYHRHPYHNVQHAADVVTLSSLHF
jgi:hypothetical protein